MKKITKKAGIFSILALLAITEMPILSSAVAQSKETTATSNPAVKQSPEKTDDCNSCTIHQNTNNSETEKETEKANIRGAIINALIVAFLTSIILLLVFILAKYR